MNYLQKDENKSSIEYEFALKIYENNFENISILEYIELCIRFCKCFRKLKNLLEAEKLLKIAF